MGKKIVAFGEIVWDMLPEGKVLGGTPSNLAYRCNAMGENAHLLSRVGNDELGQAALAKLKELEISDTNVQLDWEFKTGTVDINFDKNNETRYNITPDVAFDHIEFSAEALKLVREADCLVFGMLPQRFGISKNTLRELIKEANKAVLFFDSKLFQHFFDVQVLKSSLKVSNLVRIKEKEATFIAQQLDISYTSIEDFATQLGKQYNMDLVLITRGNNGILAHHHKHGLFLEPGFKIELEDNVGSGMAFAAGFLHYFLNKRRIEEALKFGNAAGALNSTKRGATAPFSKNDVLTFMNNTPQGFV